MRIRLAKKSDIWLLYNWVNKIDSIKNKLITNKKIPKTDHKIWYENSLKNKNRYIWIIENQHIAIGQLRFDINEDEKLCLLVTSGRQLRFCVFDVGYFFFENGKLLVIFFELLIIYVFLYDFPVIFFCMIFPCDFLCDFSL